MVVYFDKYSEPTFINKIAIFKDMGYKILYQNINELDIGHHLVTLGLIIIIYLIYILLKLLCGKCTLVATKVYGNWKKDTLVSANYFKRISDLESSLNGILNEIKNGRPGMVETMKDNNDDRSEFMKKSVVILQE
ncbi:unnamed protein product [Gordionus sp. m RMFG-2023]